MTQKKNLFDLSGKVALVTGGATGLGRAIAQGLLDHGAKILIGSRRLPTVEETVAEMTAGASSSDPMVGGVALDVTVESSAERACRRAIDLFGRLDILVNSAGFQLRKPTFELTAEEFNKMYDTHVTGSLRCCHAAGRIFREQHQGAIINIASISSFVDLVEVAAYASAKSAVMGLTRSLANEWAPHGIRTNAIAPGFFPTDLNRHLITNTDRGRRVLEHTPMARFGDQHEIAGAAIFLASDAASFVNGHTLVVDGGYLAAGVSDAVAPWGSDAAG